MLLSPWFLCVVLFSPSSSSSWWCCLPPPLSGVVFFSLSMDGADLGGPTFQSFFGVVVFTTLEALVYSPSQWRCSSLPPPPSGCLLLLSPVLLGVLLFLWVVLSSSPSFEWCCFLLLFLLCGVDVRSLLEVVLLSPSLSCGGAASTPSLLSSCVVLSASSSSFGWYCSLRLPSGAAVSPPLSGVLLFRLLGVVLPFFCKKLNF